ncbi:MAG: FecR domain-containing protein [Cyclobacteriaceae bacterium]
MTNSLNHIEDFLVNEDFRSWVVNPTPALDNYWAEWMTSNPDKRIVLLQAKSVALNIRFGEFDSDLESKANILHQIKLETNDWNTRRSVRAFALPYWARIAAILFLVFGLGVLSYLYTNNGFENSSGDIAAISTIIKENPHGVRSHLVLSDGSKVYLNAGSRIEYPSQFTDDSRNVTLTGEAYFEVAHDNQRPFRVSADDFFVEVLGTKFNVDTDQNNSVALLEGSVRVTKNATNVDTILTPGQQANLGYNDDEIIVAPFNELKVFGWTSGKLIFDGASFDEVISRLERWYGVHVSVASRPDNLDWSYTGQFENETLKSVLLNLNTVREFEYKISGDSVDITF